MSGWCSRLIRRRPFLTRSAPAEVVREAAEVVREAAAAGREGEEEGHRLAEVAQAVVEVVVDRVAQEGVKVAPAEVREVEREVVGRAEGHAAVEPRIRTCTIPLTASRALSFLLFQLP